MRLLPLLSSALLLAVAGCSTPMEDAAAEKNRAAEKTGSPFRWEVKSANGGEALTRVMIDLPPGDTKASAKQKKDVLEQIAKLELSNRRGAEDLEEVRLLPDGREVWILKDPQGIAYLVTLRPAPSGVTEIRIEGPTIFEKKS